MSLSAVEYLPNLKILNSLTNRIARSTRRKEVLLFPPDSFSMYNGRIANKSQSFFRFLKDSIVFELQNDMIQRYESNSIILHKYLRLYLDNPYMQLLEDSDFQ